MTYLKNIIIRPCNLPEDVPGEIYKQVCPFKSLYEVETSKNEYVYKCMYEQNTGYCGFRGNEITIKINTTN